MDESLNGPPLELSPTDVDDMNNDSLREQSEKLSINNPSDDNKSKASQKSSIVGGAVNTKKTRRVIGGGSSQMQIQKSKVDEQKELSRLKKEIRDKKLLEKKVAELESYQNVKQKQFKEKYGNNEPTPAHKQKINKVQQ